MINILKRRINKLKEKNLLDHILFVTKEESKYYFSGFRSSEFYLCFTKNQYYLLTDFRYIESAKQLEPFFTVMTLSNTYSIYDFLKEIQNEQVIYIENKSILYDEYQELEAIFTKEGIKPLDGQLDEIRYVKDEWELDQIKTAATIANSGFDHLLNFIKPGLTEHEIALELEYFMSKAGGEGVSFNTILASGENSSMPHALVTNRKIQAGDFITMDYGTKVNGYCSDMTKTIGVGKVSDEQKKVYATVKEAQEKSLAQVSAGKDTFEIDKVARDIIKAQGYGACFGHGLGHAVGLEIHELPYVNPHSHHTLEANMVLTVEPGIYIPNQFGVRIEDLVIVTEQGFINLSHPNKDLILI